MPDQSDRAARAKVHTSMPSQLAKPRLTLHLLSFAAINLLAAGLLSAETCITQSQMKPADRDAIAAAARTLATDVQSGDAPALRQQTMPEYAKDFAAMSSLVGSTAPKLKGAVLQVDQVYVLDASTLKTLGDGTNQDAQFFCSLNRSPAEAEFLIPALPPGRYAFAMVTAAGIKAPFRLSFLLKQNAVPAGKEAQEGNWAMAGFYPRPLTAAGHDGIWYWTSARDMVKSKQLWTGYLYYQQAQSLLQPAAFVTSTHFDKLRKEATAAAPPSLSEGISAETPLVVRNPSSKTSTVPDFRFTDLTTDDSSGANQVDIVAHLAPDPVPDPAPDKSSAASPDAAASSGKPNPKSSAPAVVLSPRERNAAAMEALLAAYPELRTSFHGVWIFADSPGKTPFVTEEPMANIH